MYGFQNMDMLAMPSLTIGVLLLWSVVWTGWALWLAARRGEKAWFVALLVLNTVGLLEIFYIFVIAKRSDTKEPEISDAAPVAGYEKQE